MLCLEVMQVFIICPMFYTLVDNPSRDFREKIIVLISFFFVWLDINVILKQALDRSPASGSIKEVFQNLKTDEKSSQEQKDLLSPVLGNIIKMTIRTLSTKKTKKLPEPIPTVRVFYSRITKRKQNSSNYLFIFRINQMSRRPNHLFDLKVIIKRVNIQSYSFPFKCTFTSK